MAKPKNSGELRQSWNNRICGHGEERASQLLAHPLNWRIHPKEQQEALNATLSTVGWVQEVLVSRNSGFMVDGHARVRLAMRQLGEDAVIPVTYLDLTPDEEAIIIASLDPIAAMAGTDAEKLDDLLRSIHTDSPEIQSLMAMLAEGAGLVERAVAEANDEDEDGDASDGIVTCPQCGAVFNPKH